LNLGKKEGVGKKKIDARRRKGVGGGSTKTPETVGSENRNSETGPRKGRGKKAQCFKIKTAPRKREREREQSG